jgi:hypothetical protein
MHPLYRDGGHEQLISNGGRIKPVFAQRDQKQTMNDLQGISANWFKKVQIVGKVCNQLQY